MNLSNGNWYLYLMHSPFNFHKSTSKTVISHITLVGEETETPKVTELVGLDLQTDGLTSPKV